MKTRITIKIKKYSFPRCLSCLIVVLPFLFGFLNDFLGLPWAIRYVLDIAWGLALVLMLCFSRQLYFKTIWWFFFWGFLFLLYTLAVYAIEFQSPLYYLWGLRNNFRFYVAFFAFALFLTTQDVADFGKWFDWLFWINIIISLVQYYGMAYTGDYLGGIFGVEKGVNAYTNLFFVIVITMDILFYLQKREKLWVCTCKCVGALAVAALAEIKFFFVEFVIIGVMAVLITDFTWRKLMVIVGGFAAICLGAFILTTLFPGSTGFLSFDFLWRVATSNEGYTSSGDLNRLTALDQINELWLRNWEQRMFGLGLGNCDTSSSAMLNTPFYQAYGHMHYTWISYAFMYLECGWFGMLFYYGFFAIIYVKAVRVGKRVQEREKVYCMLARIVAVCCVMTTAYNASLRMEAGYMAYFIMSIPYIIDREHYAKKRREHLAEKFAAQHSVP